MYKRRAGIAVLLLGIGVFVGLAVSAGLGIAGSLHAFQGCLGSSGEKQAAPENLTPALQNEKGEPAALSNICLPDFTQLAERLDPCVVNISTTVTVKAPKGFHGFQNQSPGQPFGPPGQDPFQDFFDLFQMPRGDMKRRSLGSGFVIDKSGYIVTNNHVIQEADSITVIFWDESEVEAKVVGKDPKTDVALIKVDVTRELPEAPLGNSDTLDVGDWVLAIGNPFGLKFTLTAGIVSAKGRELGAGPYDDFIQTDASINPGNSGGPLIDMQGNVVGINTAIIAGGTGIGFAIPINVAKELLPQLKEKGHVTRGWLGVFIQKVTPELAKSFGLKGVEGALVSEVTKDGPAVDSGLQQGDVIVEYQGTPVKSFSDLPRLVGATSPGTTVTVKALRNGKEKTFRIKLGELPEEKEAEAPGETGTELGLQLQEITPDLARSYDLPADKGVIVSGVTPGGLAGEAGIRVGDIIQEINRKRIDAIKDFQDAINSAPKGSTMLFLIKRREGSLFVPVEKK